jgi:hypothetical protein
MANDPTLARRRFMQRALAAAAALPVLAAFAPTASAQALKPLPADLPQAKALRYSPADVAAKDPAHKPGSNCANCQFFTAASGACQIFPGYAVKPSAWCSAWAKRA